MADALFNCECGRSFKTKKSLTSHARFCDKYINTTHLNLYKNESIYSCECGKEYEKAQSLNAHFKTCQIHRKGVPSNISHEYPFRNLSDIDKQKIIDKVSNKLRGRPLTAQHRAQISYGLSIAPSASNWGGYREGTNKWKGGKVFSKFLNREVWLDSSWEIEFVKILDKFNIQWQRTYEKFNYIFEDKRHNYTPDFYLSDFNIWIEVKGWERPVDLVKWQYFPYYLKVIRLTH